MSVSSPGYGNVPKVSIIIPSYNRADFLAQSIESALAQDYPNTEIVIADNASTDKTSEVISAYLNNPKVHVRVNSRNLGMVENWRDAIENIATGDWFLILSDDDYLIDDKYVSKAMSLLAGSVNIVMIFANGYLRYEPSGQMRELLLPYSSREPGLNVLFNRGLFEPQDYTLCNVLFERDVAIRQNVFDNPSNLSCDLELFLKLCLLGDVGFVRDFVSVYRVHEGNLLKTVSQDYSRLTASFDSIGLSYQLGVELLARGELNCDQVELDEWQFRNMKAYLRFALYHTVRSFPGFYAQTCKVAESYCPGVSGAVLRSPMFLVQLAIARFLRFFSN
jgi:glycosyltransferase involved in cell wall biosynthesis